MPFSITERNTSRRPSVSAMAQGGYAVAQRPNPNDAMSTYQRGQPGVPQSGMNPAVTDTGESALSANVGLMQRGQEARRAYDAAESQRNPTHNIGVAADPMWEAVKQSLYERGAGSLTEDAGRDSQYQGGGETAATRKSGFYGSQRPSMNGLNDIARQQRQTQVTNFMANQRGF